MMNKINSEKTFLGIELGSTRIKASLIDDEFSPIASGSYEWENKLENGYWTYSLDEIHNGIRGCFADLSENVLNQYGVRLTNVGAIGVSGMMHGYLAFDENDELLIPFRTWRNTTTKKAANELTNLFKFNIPQRWSIAHLYQAILSKEEHISKISYITTLAGYIHYLLTGRLELGIGEASGVFPVSGKDYDKTMVEKFNHLVKSNGLDLNICDMLPMIRLAGEKGEFLTEKGARFLDPKGNLKAGISVCPPEGDAGTGMVATNAVLPKTGNVSAGTSIFAMLVLEKNLENVYKEIDIVTTPEGFPVAMVHCNNCSGEIDTWVRLFGEFAEIAGIRIAKSTVYETLYNHSVSANDDCDGITVFNYLSGEHVTGVENGRPMYFRNPQSKMNLANFMKAQLYSCMATLKLGMDILFENEEVFAKQIQAHGGLFKVKNIAQQILANALNTPVSVLETAGEGGAWGMALLAAYMVNGNGMALGDWLSDKVFAQMSTNILTPDKKGVEGFKNYIISYKEGLKFIRCLEENVC